MTGLSPDAVAALVAAFRDTLQQLEQLYLDAAEVTLQQQLTQRGPAEQRSLMRDLYRGLAIKIFFSVAEADRAFSTGERALCQVLLEQVWQQQLSKHETDQALAELRKQAADLRFVSLYRPFDAGPMRDRVGTLETLVVRLANIVAKIDGSVGDEEVRRLKWLQQELQRHLVPLRMDRPKQHEPERRPSSQAVERLPADAQQLRGQLDLAESSAPPDERTTEERLAEAQQELAGLIGLAGIKEEMQGLVNLLRLQKARQEAGLPATQVSLHMVFSGNPGTGKTTVARIVGRVLGALGILKKGHLVETDRSGLVAEYAGQSGPKTHQRVDEALDGVLFIDEAYSLVSEKGDDPYGAEAVQALLKRMEDDRDRLVVILAGYTRPLERLLQSNPGLTSRFSRRLEFPDYSASELGCIFGRMCKAHHYELPAAARFKLLLAFQQLVQSRDEHFGNGRLVRNVYEKAIGRLANRVASIAPLTRELLTTLEADDLAVEGASTDIQDRLDEVNAQVQITCPNCQKSSPLLAAHPWVVVCACQRCGHVFEAEWGEPLD